MNISHHEQSLYKGHWVYIVRDLEHEAAVLMAKKVGGILEVSSTVDMDPIGKVVMWVITVLVVLMFAASAIRLGL